MTAMRCLLFLLFIGLVGGCTVIDESRVHNGQDDSLPWTGRADWEGQNIGIPIE